MRTSRLLAVLVLAFLAAGLYAQQAQPPQPPEDPTQAMDKKILAEVAERSEHMKSLQHLTDMIGPRLTGTEKLKQANDWTAERFKDYGLANVRLEAWTIPHSWHRGTAAGRILKPATHPLTLASAGWSPNTNGPMRGPVVYVKAEKVEELEPYRGKLRGAIVITTEYKPPAPGIPPAKPERQRPTIVPPERDFQAIQKFRQQMEEFFKVEGVIAVLRNSNKEHGLLDMSASGRDYQIGLLPTAFVTREGYGLIWRLLESKQPMEVEIEIRDNVFSKDPVTVYNTVGEIPGAEKPDEIVLLGAHLDSWDLGTGATDDGTGVAAVLEAARALNALAIHPRRTIRFVLFSGEEQGLHGSKAYVKAHEAELPKISAVVVHDTGTGRVRSLNLQGNYQLREIMDKVVAPLRSIGFEELSLRSVGGSDHTSFNTAGVPGFFCDQDGAEYNKTHHSQSDTFDKVWKDDLMEGAQVLGVVVYNIAQLPELLPRKTPPPAAQPARR